jgi:hypothetical protein
MVIFNILSNFFFPFGRNIDTRICIRFFDFFFRLFFAIYIETESCSIVGLVLLVLTGSPVSGNFMQLLSSTISAQNSQQ